MSNENNPEQTDKKKSKWNVSDAFSMAVRPVRVTVSHARQMFKHASQSAQTWNPLKKEFWSADNYSREEMINAFDKYCATSSSALALGVVAGIGVIGSPVLAGIAYAGLNTQMKADPEMRTETDKKWHEFMEANKAEDGSIRDRIGDFVAKPISVAKESYSGALDDLHEGKYVSAAKGLAVSTVMGSTLKVAGVAAMTGAGKAVALYSGASVATNAIDHAVKKVFNANARGVPDQNSPLVAPNAERKASAPPAKPAKSSLVPPRLKGA